MAFRRSQLWALLLCKHRGSKGELLMPGDKTTHVLKRVICVNRFECGVS